MALWRFRNKWLKAHRSFTIYKCQWCEAFHIGHTVKALITEGDIVIQF